MNAKILRIPAPRRKRREPTAEALAAILDTLRRIERRIERLEQTAPPLAWWEEEQPR